LNNRSVDYDRAFAPFGEVYKNFGSTANNNFTGDTQDIVAGTYDTENRELNPSQGRWLSPDPAGLQAVDPSSPQSWNRYVYVLNNPLLNIDPTGLDCVYLDNAGLGVESIDQNSNFEECTGPGANGTPNGGFWVEGTFTGGIAYWNSNDVWLTGVDENGNPTSSFTDTVTPSTANEIIDQQTEIVVWPHQVKRYNPGFFQRVSDWANNILIMHSDAFETYSCIVAPDMSELTATLHGEKPRPSDEGHPEGAEAVYVYNINSTKNGGGKTTKTPWGETSVSPSNERVGNEEGASAAAAAALVISHGAEVQKCLHAK